MKLEVGKYYEDDTGSIAKIVKFNKDKGSYEDNFGSIYNQSGKSFYDDDYYLIHEVIVTPVGKKEPELKLEVGKKYKMRNGGVAIVTAYDPSEGIYPYKAGSYAYTEDGAYATFEKKSVDLIEEIE